MTRCRRYSGDATRSARAVMPSAALAAAAAIAFASPRVPASARSAADARYGVADGRGGLGERGEPCVDRLMLGDGAVRRERADDDRAVALGADLAQRGDATEVDQRLGLRQPELHEREQAVAAGQQLRVACSTE